jgi:hypothetical protein
MKDLIKRILREEDFIPLEDLNTVIKDYEGGFDVFIMNGDKKIGEISFIEEDKPNQYTISDATIDDEYKGNRIYPKTIISLFKEKPNIIINSVFRSPEAQKAWIYLLSNLPPNIGKSVKYYKDEDTTLFQLKSRNLQESIRRILREESNKDILIDGLYDPIYEENGIVLFKEPKHLNEYSKFGIKKSNVISGKEFNKKYVDFSNKKLHKVLYKDGITLGGNLGEGKYWCSTEYCLSVYLGETHQSKEYSKYVKEVVDFKLGDNLKILVKKYISDDLWETYYNMNLQESIRRILREELAPSIRRRLNFHDIKRIIDNTKIENFLKNQDIEKSVHNTIRSVMYDLMPKELEDHEDEYHKVLDEIKKYLINHYTEELTQYFEKRQRDVDNEKNPLGIKYIFIKHDKPYGNSGWSGFATGFNSFDDMITKYGNWVEVDWDEIKKKLDNINDYPVQTYTNTMNSRPLRISSVGDKGNDWGYNFSIIKQIPSENLDKVKDIQTEGLHDTSWENDKGDKITLIDLLNATGDIPVQKISVEELKPHLLSWDGNEDEIKKIERADLQYPILIFVDYDGSFISIIDGHHRAQKAVRKGLETIKAKIIPINSLPKDIRKVFSHMGREEMKEGELTERCWKGYTQKGMKTMFGKRYPNCVKIKKK